jgi:hypothetical protein
MNCILKCVSVSLHYHSTSKSFSQGLHGIFLLQEEAVEEASYFSLSCNAINSLRNLKFIGITHFLLSLLSFLHVLFSVLQLFIEASIKIVTRFYYYYLYVFIF